MGINTIPVPYFYDMETAHTQILGHDFILHPSGVCYWEQTQWLLISDVHLGKVSHFRKHGAAVPQNAIQKNFTSMNAAVAHFFPQKNNFHGRPFPFRQKPGVGIFQGVDKGAVGKVGLGQRQPRHHFTLGL